MTMYVGAMFSNFDADLKYDFLTKNFYKNVLRFCNGYFNKQYFLTLFLKKFFKKLKTRIFMFNEEARSKKAGAKKISGVEFIF